jgi:CheY-like chemotaxis protein
LEQQLANDLPGTMADRHQIEQVLVNLIVNATSALTTCPKPRLLTVGTEENGNYIRIVVADNGPGIPERIIEQIFDPFFTTKPVGKGTGLGLTISNTIVQEHRGRILAENQPTGGARFVVELPIVEAPTITPATQNRSVSATVKEDPRQRSVLIVDDEPGIIAVLSEIVSELGHRVTTAANGAEAMKRVAEHTFDVILSDMRMPDMDGQKFYRALKEKDESLAHRIIFVTGDTVSTDTRAFLEETGNRWLSKPFTIQQIINAVNEVLNGEVVAA